jgi:hypothetical protein
MTTAAAVAQTREVKSEDLRASALQSGTAVIQEAAKLLQSLEGADSGTLERVSALLKAGLAGVRGEISSSEAVATEPSALEARRQEFVTKYNIKVLSDGQVSFTLPSGTSRIDLINEAQGLAPDLLGRNAVYPSRLGTWKKDSAFTTNVAEDLERSIDGNVRSSTRMTRAEQEAKGWNNVDLCDLATAHVAYFIATGKDLFANNVVRARGGALGFYDDGLGVDDCRVDVRRSYVAASAALPPRN